MSGSETLESADLPIQQSIYSAEYIDEAGDVVPDDSDVDELMREVTMAAAMVGDYQEEDEKEDRQLWAGFRMLWAENRQLRIENGALRAELREVQLRISDMCAAVAGYPDAKDRVCQRVSFEQRRDTLVRILTRNPSWDWATYVNSLPGGLSPYAAGEALQAAAKAAVPHFEEKARIPRPVRTDSVWKALAKRKSKEDRRTRETIEAEYTRCMQEAQEAQRVLALLKDEEIWHLLKQN